MMRHATKEELQAQLAQLWEQRREIDREIDQVNIQLGKLFVDEHGDLSRALEALHARR